MSKPAYVDIEVTENAVKVVAERKTETKTDDNGRTRTEFYYGKFQRVIPLRAYPKHSRNSRIL